MTTLAHMDHFHAAKAAPVRRAHALLSHYVDTKYELMASRA